MLFSVFRTLAVFSVIMAIGDSLTDDHSAPGQNNLVHYEGTEETQDPRDTIMLLWKDKKTYSEENGERVADETLDSKKLRNSFGGQY